MFKRTLIIVAACLVTVANVAAQAPAPEQPVVAPAAAQATHNCVKPPQPGRLATKSHRKLFDEESKKYRGCLQDYVTAQSELVKQHAERANAAIKEFNDYVAEMNKLAEAAK